MTRTWSRASESLTSNLKVAEYKATDVAISQITKTIPRKKSSQKLSKAADVAIAKIAKTIQKNKTPSKAKTSKKKKSVGVMDDTRNEYLSYCAKKINRNKMFLAKVVTDLKNVRKRAKSHLLQNCLPPRGLKVLKRC